jgi:hypothetical protein
LYCLTGICDIETLDVDLVAKSGAAAPVTYAASKFVQLLSAHYWRRQLGSSATVVAVSPGLIPGTGIGRNSDVKIPSNVPDAKSVQEGEFMPHKTFVDCCLDDRNNICLRPPTGAQSLLNAFDRDDLPSDPNQIFLTSWGEWWPTSVYTPSLDEALQDKWCPSKEDIEKEAGISS